MESRFHDRLSADMRLAGLAAKTHKVYHNAVRMVGQHHGRPAEDLLEEEVRDYLLGLVDRGTPRGTFKGHHFGLQFFYVTTLDRDWSLFSKKDSPADTKASAACPDGRSGATPSVVCAKPGPPRLPVADVCLWPTYQRGHDP